jgi:hypothetical protein
MGCLPSEEEDGSSPAGPNPLDVDGPLAHPYDTTFVNVRKKSAPVDDRPAVGVVRLAVLPTITELAGPGVLVELYAQGTPEEEELGFSDFVDSHTVDGDLDNVRFPGEEDVMHLAGKWSINPLELDAYDSEGPGFLGTLPY